MIRPKGEQNMVNKLDKSSAVVFSATNIH